MGKLGLAFLAVLVLPTALSSEQEQAPTVEQCRADLSAWSFHMDCDITSDSRCRDQLLEVHDQWVSAITKLDFRELRRRSDEMSACSNVDMDLTANPPRVYRYIMLHDDFTNEIAVRELSFIGRHDMYYQFLAEDRAGQR